MIKTLILAGALTVAATGFAVAGPTDFYATPMNSGAPTNLPGETIIPGMSQAMMIVNGVTQPILQPLLAPGGGNQAAPAMERPMRGHRMMRHRRMSRKMMMKRRMMER